MNFKIVAIISVLFARICYGQQTVSAEWFISSDITVVKDKFVIQDAHASVGIYDHSGRLQSIYRGVNTRGAGESIAMVAPYGDHIVAAGNGVALVRLDGSEVWKNAAISAIGSTPTVLADRTIVVSCLNGKTYFILPNGDIAKTIDVRAVSSLTPISSGDGILIPNVAGDILFVTRDREIEKVASVEPDVIDRMKCENEDIAVLSERGSVVVFNRDLKIRLAMTLKLRARAIGIISLRPDEFIVTSKLGEVICFGINGGIIWTRNLDLRPIRNAINLAGRAAFTGNGITYEMIDKDGGDGGVKKFKSEVRYISDKAISGFRMGTSNYGKIRIWKEAIEQP